MQSLQLATIPSELKMRVQWVCWCFERSKKGKLTKVPYQTNGQKADTTDPTTWSSLDKAISAQKGGRNKFGKPFDGIGFVFNGDFTGIDCDHCIGPDGSIDQWALDILRQIGSFADKSPNDGIHIFVEAVLPPDSRHKFALKGLRHEEAAVEMYSSGRFFTWTGNHVEGTPETIEPHQTELDILYHELLAHIQKTPTENPQKTPVNFNLSDSQLIEKACNASNGTLFASLWRGDIGAYPSQSEADQAFCNLLAFWTGKEASRMDRLFRQSGLYREKWDRNARAGETYGEGTIREAIANCRETYEKHKQWTNYDPGQKQSSSNGKGNGHQTQKRVAQPDLETIIQRLEENEYGDGLLFAQVFNGQVCHDHSEKAWYLWNEHHWKKDVTGKIKQMVSGHLGSIYLKARGDVHKLIVDVQAEVEQRQKENKEDKKLPELNTRLAYLGGLMEALEKRARALRGANRMKNALTFAMSEHNIGITADIWDSDPWLVAVKNGVVDLRTGQIRDGYPIDYIRSVSPTEWTGLNTPCPRFERFLQEIFEVLPEAQLQKLTNDKYYALPKEEQERTTAEHRGKLIDFLQRLFGYALAGLSTEAIFPLLYGEEGRNGKDTLFKVLKFVLGIAIADAISNDVFLSTDRGRAAGAATPHLADLQGKRMVWGSETKQGDRINVSQIKQLTGGGDISARKNYGDQYTFAPTHTLFLMTNNKPHADAKDKAFWTRACLIEFALRFVDNPQGAKERKADTNLTEDLKAEASGILAWLVRGCLDYQKQGLNRPEIVLLSTESYRASEDNIQQFIDECCVLHDKASVGAQKLYDTYVVWCKSNNLNHINGKLFGEDVSKRFKKERKKAGLEYQKIGIRTDEMPPEDPSGVGSTPHGVGSTPHSTPHTEPASEAPSGHTEKTDGVGYVGYNQEVPYSTPHEDHNSTLPGYTLHTLHLFEEEEGLKQPLEPINTVVDDQEGPYTDPTPEIFKRDYPQEFWSIGKSRNYPEIPHLGLKNGKNEWGRFLTFHRLLLPEVIAYLGGAQ